MKNIYTLKFNRGGLFFLINNVIDFLDIAGKNDFIFNMKWENSLYEDPSKNGPVWNYYFENIFDIDQCKTYPIYEYKNFRKNHLTAPRIKDGRMEPLLLPRDRYLANQYIEEYFKLKPHIQKIISQYKNTHYNQHIIGLHLRGPGRLHGGMPVFLKKLELKEDVPYQLYFEHVDNYLKDNPNAKIFLCSDSNMIIGECIEKYGDKIITYDSYRSDYGEMHEIGITNDDKSFSKYKLGEDVLVEAYLLAQTDYFIHGNSNVSNFVLCKNPTFKYKYVFEDININWRLIYLKRDMGKFKMNIKKLVKRTLRPFSRNKNKR
jgi:hypothetical protein